MSALQRIVVSAAIGALVGVGYGIVHHSGRIARLRKDFAIAEQELKSATPEPVQPEPVAVVAESATAHTPPELTLVPNATPEPIVTYSESADGGTHVLIQQVVSDADIVKLPLKTLTVPKRQRVQLNLVNPEDLEDLPVRVKFQRKKPRKSELQ